MADLVAHLVRVYLHDHPYVYILYLHDHPYVYILGGPLNLPQVKCVDGSGQNGPTNAWTLARSRRHNLERLSNRELMAQGLGCDVVIRVISVRVPVRNGYGWLAPQFFQQSKN